MYLKGFISLCIIVLVGVSFKDTLFVSNTQVETPVISKKVAKEVVKPKGVAINAPTLKDSSEIKREYRANLKAFNNKSTSTQLDFPAWESRGPIDSGGRVNAVVADPQNPNKVYVGAASGGVWKSVDGVKTTRLFSMMQEALA